MKFKIYLILILLLISFSYILSKEDYYSILGLKKNASEAQIKRAYHKLAVKYHPDKDSSENAKKIFTKLSHAYQVLSDPEKKAIYDEQGENAFDENGEQKKNGFPGGGGQNFNGQNFNFEFKDPFDLFANLFGKKGGAGGGKQQTFDFGGAGSAGNPFASMFGGAGGGMGGSPGGFNFGGPKQGGAKSRQHQQEKTNVMYSKADNITMFTRANIKGLKNDNDVVWLIKFYSPNCAHCRSFAPTFKKLAISLRGIAKLGAVDCEADKNLCNEFKVSGVPVLYLFPFGEKSKPIEFESEMTIKNIDEFVTNHIPDLIERVKSPLINEGKSFMDFLKKNPKLPHLLFISNKTQPSILLRSFSGRLSKNILFGMIGVKSGDEIEEGIKTKIGPVKSLPALFILTKAGSWKQLDVKAERGELYRSLRTYI